MCYMLIIAALYLAVFFLAIYDPKDEGRSSQREYTHENDN